MRFFWVGDKVAQEMYKLRWHPGQKNLADYQSKHHVMSHHIMYAPGIYTWRILQDSYQEHRSQVL
jgi:hypothetical protein